MFYVVSRRLLVKIGIELKLETCGSKSVSSVCDVASHNEDGQNLFVINNYHWIMKYRDQLKSATLNESSIRVENILDVLTAC